MTATGQCLVEETHPPTIVIPSPPLQWPELLVVSGGSHSPQHRWMSLVGYSMGKVPLQKAALNGLTLRRQTIYLLSAIPL